VFACRNNGFASCGRLYTPNFKIQETFDDFVEPWVREAVIGRPEVKDGYFSQPETPGLGVDWILRKSTFPNIHRWRVSWTSGSPAGKSEIPTRKITTLANEI
jgi:hypothetical protein